MLCVGILMKKRLLSLGLNSNNSIVIGSGILNVLGIRKSNDIDIVVDENIFTQLKNISGFKYSEHMNGKICKLSNSRIEIVSGWEVLGKFHRFKDFQDKSIIIDGVRYITLDFIYKAKKSWLKEKAQRPKDVEDLKLIEEYKKTHVT